MCSQAQASRDEGEHEKLGEPGSPDAAGREAAAAAAAKEAEAAAAEKAAAEEQSR